MISIDDVEYAASKHAVLTEHIGMLYSQYLKPFSLLLKNYTDLPPPLTANDIITSAQAVESAEDTYIRVKSTSILQKVARLKYEAEHAEHVISRLLEPLRVAVKSGRSSSAKKESVSGQRMLISLLMSSDEDFFTRCSSKSTFEELASTLVELQSSPSPGKSAPNTLKIDSTDRELREAVMMFDLEIFVAYMEEWKQRVDDIVGLTNSNDFEKTYKKLCTVRLTVQRAIESYEANIMLMNSSLQQINEVRNQLLIYKPILEQLAYIELSDSVEVTLPPETAGPSSSLSV
eukprot:CAMPEP_0182433478 /NCGR_PEP_ID=MMETSP1167-20130531/63493_1 /TAXON_ID=2988 /ORGANISM="Mallomonas Sp, Strain CCMP3275" /LENGTH=288 /DNA_ID=CAMNT_0024622213 /DNA_START=419 /DNA_END=1285 /DNA_ORIENTATION=+